MKTLILIDGQELSGKTTLGSNLAKMYRVGNEWERLSVTHHEPDFYFFDKMWNYSFDETKLPQAHTQCKIIVKGAMKRGDNAIIVSHHWDNFWQKKYYLNLAKQFDYDVQEIFLRAKFKSVIAVDNLVRETNNQLSLVSVERKAA